MNKNLYGDEDDEFYMEDINDDRLVKILIITIIIFRLNDEDIMMMI